MRISFIIPFTGMTGGIAVVLEYYRQLTALGHEVSIFYPIVPYWKFWGARPLFEKIRDWPKALLRNVLKPARALALFSENIPVKAVPTVSDASIPDADAVIATAWPTAYDIAGLSPRKGRKFYFVQHYEAWSGRESDVDNSYRLPIDIITTAPWLTDLMKNKFRRNEVTEIHYGIRLDRFYPPAVKKYDRASVLLMAHDLEWKGTRDAVEALAIVKKRYPQLTVRMFGMCARPNAPFSFEYHKNPRSETLITLYREASVFIFPSHSEGWGLHVMEAMACGCALVATNVGCVPLLNNGRNMILAEIKNPQSIADGVIKLLESETLAESVAKQGLARVRELDWSASALKLLKTVSAPSEKPRRNAL